MRRFPPLGIFLFIVVLVFCFTIGRQISLKPAPSSGSATNPNTVVFKTAKTDKPTLAFYGMSFCPYDNQVELALGSVYQSLSDKVTFTPHYLFNKINDLPQFCQNREGNVASCPEFVKNNFFKTTSECETTIKRKNLDCQNEKNYLKASNGGLYGALHGRQEANQNIREICAWNQLGNDKKKWWQFVENINTNCHPQDADTCWEQQGKAAGLDTDKITECFNKDAVSIIENEIAFSAKLNINSTPSLFINDSQYPPLGAYTTSGLGRLTVGSQSFAESKYRQPNSIKTAICVAFNKTPSECQVNLNDFSQISKINPNCSN